METSPIPDDPTGEKWADWIAYNEALGAEMLERYYASDAWQRELARRADGKPHRGHLRLV